MIDTKKIVLSFSFTFICLTCFSQQETDEFSEPLYQEYLSLNGIHVILNANNSANHLETSILVKIGYQDENELERNFTNYINSLYTEKVKENLNNPINNPLSSSQRFYHNIVEDYSFYSQTEHPDNHYESLERVGTIFNLESSITDASMTAFFNKIKLNNVTNQKRRPLDFLESHLFSKHPYKNILTDKNLEQTKAQDIRSFYKTYFIPKNAVLIVSGRFNPTEIKSLIESIFTSKNTPPPTRKQIEEENTFKAINSFTQYGKEYHLPRIFFASIIPNNPVNEKEIYSLKMGVYYLSLGYQSKLYQKLVKKNNLARNVVPLFIEYKDFIIWGFEIVGRVQGNYETIQNEINIELTNLRDKPLEQTTIDLLKNQAETDLNKDMLRLNKLNERLGVNHFFYNNAMHHNIENECFQTINGNDIQKTFKKHKNYIILKYLPQTRLSNP